MITITAFNQQGEDHFRPGEHNLDIKPKPYIGEVTNQDFIRMMDINSDYWKSKVRKLLDTRPFNK